MANFELVFVYDSKHAAELRKKGLTCPRVRRSNQMPTADDLLWAIDSLDNADYEYLPREDGELSVQELNEGYWIGIGEFDWQQKNGIPGEYFTMCGATSRLGLAILIKLAERCGQLLVYPDTGDSPIVVDATMDADAIAEFYEESLEVKVQPDEPLAAWQYFFDQMYGSK